MLIRFERSFFKDLKKINDRAVKRKVEEQILNIKKIETLKDLNNFKKIKGTTNAFRIRIGDYRIGIFYENNELVFARILNRKDIYKYFPR